MQSSRPTARFFANTQNDNGTQDISLPLNMTKRVDFRHAGTQLLIANF